jgi:hypothetical protein
MIKLWLRYSQGLIKSIINNTQPVLLQCKIRVDKDQYNESKLYKIVNRISNTKVWGWSQIKRVKKEKILNKKLDFQL